MMDPPRAGGSGGSGLLLDPPARAGGGGGAGGGLGGMMDPSHRPGQSHQGEMEGPPTIACPVCSRDNFKTLADLERHAAQCGIP